jgi:hypothetical protein
MRRVLFAIAAGCSVVMALLGACTIQVDPPPVKVEKVEIDCIIVELPSGTTEVHCPDSGPASDATDAE